MISLNGLRLNLKTPLATIALSSLTDETISESESLLLTAVGRWANSDVEYNNDRTRQLSPRRSPTLIEAIEARVEMMTARTDLKVWVISEKGEAVTRLKTEYANGVLGFEIGPQPSWNPLTMYYLIIE